ncbi:hypothetical protein L596_025950 [Steinernema carpocapsae]|uniref:Uncharacterized protein n=1 Tax=Steinernema carpocapsae TaxID=34508 RepID=A0A4U5M998_STECR|nr:hypothetical protein L596_025950 [Steinernema carpocapsae]
MDLGTANIFLRQNAPFLEKSSLPERFVIRVKKAHRISFNGWLQMRLKGEQKSIAMAKRDATAKRRFCRSPSCESVKLCRENRTVQ